MTRLHFFPAFILIQHILSHLSANQIHLSFLHFQGLAHASEDAVHFIVVVTIDITFVLVVVVVVVAVVVVAVVAVNAILLADDKIQFPHVPASTATVVLAVVALFFHSS